LGRASISEAHCAVLLSKHAAQCLSVIAPYEFWYGLFRMGNFFILFIGKFSFGCTDIPCFVMDFQPIFCDNIFCAKPISTFYIYVPFFL
jgi:hypothetical protein